MYGRASVFFVRHVRFISLWYTAARCYDMTMFLSRYVMFSFISSCYLSLRRCVSFLGGGGRRQTLPNEADHSPRREAQAQPRVAHGAVAARHCTLHVRQHQGEFIVRCFVYVYALMPAGTVVWA